MLLTPRKIRSTVLVSLAAIWMVSVISLGLSAEKTPECDPYCPMEMSQKKEISYKTIEKRVILMSGVIGWISHYYNK
jgi:hypothetical protein